MSSEEVYIMQETDGEWVQPTPVRVAIGEAVASATDLEQEDIGRLEEYVDSAALRKVLEADEDDTLTVQVEGYDVTVHANGDIHVES